MKLKQETFDTPEDMTNGFPKYFDSSHPYPNNNDNVYQAKPRK